jgi:hypothetical protein
MKNSIEVVRAAVARIDVAIEEIHAPFVHAIIEATSEQNEQALTDVINALKTDKCAWLFEQGKAFALTCVEGATWQGNKIVLADDADELSLHPCADIRGATKWWQKVAKPSGKAQSMSGKLSAFVKFLDRASKRDGPELIKGETRAQAAQAAQAMALIASGAVTFADIIALATMPVADDVDAQIAAELKLVG